MIARPVLYRRVRATVRMGDSRQTMIGAFEGSTTGPFVIAHVATLSIAARLRSWTGRSAQNLTISISGSRRERCDASGSIFMTERGANAAKRDKRNA